MTPSPRAWTIGQNTFQLEGSDLLWSKLQGTCSLEEAVEMVRLYRELGQAHPFFILGDMETANGMEAEARRYISENLEPQWIQGAIYFNARLLHRALLQGLLIASEMFRAQKSPLHGKIHFVATREKAQALIVQMRPPPEEPRA